MTGLTSIYIFLGIAILVLAAWLVSFIWLRPWTIHQFYLRVMLMVMLDGPELLTMLGILERVKINFHNALLSDVSEKHTDLTYWRLHRRYRQLMSYPRSSQDAVTRLSTDILGYYLDDQIRSEPFRYLDYPVNQMFGAQSSYPDFMLNLHPVDGWTNAKNYIKRLQKSQKRFAQLVESLRVRQAYGAVPPRFVLQRVLDEMNGFIASPPEKHTLYTTFAEKLDKLKLSPARRQSLLDEARHEIEQTVYPAYRELIACCADLEQAATDDDGVWKLPDGDAYYAHCLRSSTTTDLTPEEVHNIGLAEVARIEREMSTILEQLGYTGVQVAQQMEAFAKEERFLYPNTDEGKEACLEDYRRILADIEALIAPVFDLRPKAGLEVRRVPAFKEKTSAGAYYQMAALGGGRPGVFYANLRDMNEVPRFGMKTLSYHEGIPGHHFQISIAMELRKVPLFRRMIPFTAYIEGWALYAEKLARELGAYQDDPYGELGYLSSELFRAVRLVVDTGIHYKRWNRQQAIAYMQAHTGMAYESIVSEVERYIVMPGQACAYKMGEIKIVQLREKVQTALGERFDLRQFHNLLLKNGAMPLTLLEQQVDAYLEA